MSWTLSSAPHPLPSPTLPERLSLAGIGQLVMTLPDGAWSKNPPGWGMRMCANRTESEQSGTIGSDRAALMVNGSLLKLTTGYLTNFPQLPTASTQRWFAHEIH